MKNKMLTSMILIIAIVMALAPWGADKTQAASLTKITVAVPHPSAINWIPLHVAIGEGYFKDEGLEINVEAVDGSSQVLQAMSAGKAQIGAPVPAPSCPPVPGGWTSFLSTISIRKPCSASW